MERQDNFLLQWRKPVSRWRNPDCAWRKAALETLAPLRPKLPGLRHQKGPAARVPAHGV